MRERRPDRPSCPKIDLGLVVPPAQIVRRTRTVAELGFDGVFFSEVRSDPLIAAGAAASAAGGLDVGTAITVAFARNPMTLAVAARDLQEYAQGRFILGIGPQIRPHITNRFSMPWSNPAARMREYIAAMRAIWRCFMTGEKLDFRGEFYSHTLMTPTFVPEPNEYPAPPVFLGAAGPQMTRVAVECADGIFLHNMASPDYVRHHVLPLISAHHRVAAAGFGIRAMPYLAAGVNDEALEKAIGEARAFLAFHASTPAYRHFLDHHGWGDLQPELNRLSKDGRWTEMTALIDDEVLNTFAVIGRPEAAGRIAAERFSGFCDRLSFFSPAAPSDEVWAGVAAGVRSHAQAE